jgi:hypothetical protein
VVKGCGLTGATTGQVSIYGTHWADHFTSTTAGMIEIFCNEPTTNSASQCAITAGTPRFNSAGQVALTAIGDQVTWTSPYAIKGHTALANLAATLTGTNTGNLTYEYQIDGGTWKTLSGANLSGETIDPATGFVLGVRATCATANAGNLLTNIRITTVTTSTAQSTNLYPLETVTVAVTNLTSPSEVRIFEAGTTNEIDGAESVTTGSFETVIDAATYPEVDISILSLGYQNLRYLGQATTGGIELFASQVIDRQYANT